MKASAAATAAGCLRRQKKQKEIKFYGEFFCLGDWFLSPSSAPTLRGESVRKRGSGGEKRRKEALRGDI